MAVISSQDGWARTQIRIPPDLHQKAHELAKEEGRSFNSQLVVFIREGIKLRAAGSTSNAQAA